MTRPIVLLALLLYLPFLLFSQIRVEGVLLLGDTSQVLMMQTKNGDQFVGSVHSWSKDSILFNMMTGDLLRFGTGEVEKIIVQKGETSYTGEDLSWGVFTIVSDDGRVREGQITGMYRGGYG